MVTELEALHRKSTKISMFSHFSLAWLHAMKHESIVFFYNSFTFISILHEYRELSMEVLLPVKLSKCRLVRTAFTSRTDVEKQNRETLAIGYYNIFLLG